MDLQALVKSILEYPGVTRKAPISRVVSHFPGRQENVVADFGEDAAVLVHGDEALLLAADGIMEKMVRAEAWWAGYCAVLVNLHDIAAMGGVPLAVVDILSFNDDDAGSELLRGMHDAVEKFGVPLVGGHTHPDTGYNAVDVAILGTAPRDKVVYSHTASSGDAVIFAMDLDGSLRPSTPYAWDTTCHKLAGTVRKQLMVMSRIAGEGLLTAGKDISNPGALGTLGMLLESSGRGAEIDLAKIPRPGGVELDHWLRVYQGCGFVVTCEPAAVGRVVELFGSVGLDAAAAGTINDSKKLDIVLDGERATLFDFNTGSITGIKG